MVWRAAGDLLQPDRYVLARTPAMRTARVILVVTVLCGLFPPSSASADEYGVAFLDHGTPTVLTAGSRATVSLTVRNTGTLSWSDRSSSGCRTTGQRGQRGRPRRRSDRGSPAT